MKKRIFAAVLSALLVIALTGCSESILTSKDTSDGEQSSEPFWTVADDDVVAWSTNASLSAAEKEYYDITFADFYLEYSFTIANNGIDETNSAYSQYAEYYRENTINMLANERMLMKKAEEYGLDKLSDEDMTEIEEKFNQYLTEWYDTFEERAKSELAGGDTSGASSGESTEISAEKLREKEKELFGEYIGAFNVTEEILLSWQKNMYIQNKVIDYLCKDVSVSREDAAAEVNKLIEQAKAAYAEDVEKYETNSTYYNVWIPEGSREVKYILVALSTSDYAEIYYARNESDADNDAIDKLRDEKLAEIKDKAQAALDKANAEGADFDALIKEYSSDYSEQYAGLTTLVVKNSVGISKSLYDGIMAIEKKGGISPLIPTDKGYYIVQYTDDAAITDKELEEVIESKQSSMESAERSEIWDKNISAWRKETAYEFDYEKLKISEPEEESSDAESKEESADSSADSKTDSKTDSTSDSSADSAADSKESSAAGADETDSTAESASEADSADAAESAE